MAETKAITLHPINSQTGSIDTNINLYPKTIIPQILEVNGEVARLQRRLTAGNGIEINGDTNVIEVNIDEIQQSLVSNAIKYIKLSDYETYQDLYDEVGLNVFIAMFDNANSLYQFFVNNDDYYLTISNPYGVYLIHITNMNERTDVLNDAEKKYATNNYLLLTSLTGTMTQEQYNLVYQFNAKVIHVTNSNVDYEFYPYSSIDSSYLYFSQFAKSITSNGEFTITRKSVRISKAVNSQNLHTYEFVTDTLANTYIKTKLDEKFGDVMEVAEGKCKTYILSYNDTLTSIKDDISDNGASIYDQNGNNITSAFVNGDYDNYFDGFDHQYANPYFNSQNSSITINGEDYIVYVFRQFLTDLVNEYNYILYVTHIDAPSFDAGDIFLVIETVDSNGDTLPDRWVAGKNTFFKLETAKIDLSAYPTKSGPEVITGGWTFKDNLKVKSQNESHTCIITQDNNSNLYFNIDNNIGFLMGGSASRCKLLYPISNNTYDLGTSDYKWKKGYFADTVYTGDIAMTNSSKIYNNNFVINNGSADVFKVDGVNGQVKSHYTILPITTNTNDLGNSSYCWRNIYVYTFYRESTPYIQLRTNDINVTKDLIANGGTESLGTSSYTWKDLYLSGKAYIPEIADANGTSRLSISTAGVVTLNGNMYPNVNEASLLGYSARVFAATWTRTLKGITTLTQAQYDALVSGGTVDADTLYFIEEE